MAAIEYINQGEFDQEIHLQEVNIEKDSRSATVRTFQTKHTPYAKVVEMNIAESIINEGSRMRTMIEVTTYFLKINNRWRIVWDGDNYDITTVNKVPSSPFMKVVALKEI